MTKPITEPATFSPEGTLVAIVLAPVVFAVGVILLQISRGYPQWSDLAFAILSAIAVMAAFYRYQLRFDPDALHYRRWGRTVTVLYKEIGSITLVNNRRGMPVRAVVHTKSGEELPIWWKLFPKEASERFLALGPINEELRIMP